MVIKNYNKQNHFNLEDGTSIQGILFLTTEEFKNNIDFLVKEHKKAVKKIETYKRDALDYAARIATENKNNPEPFSIGVTGTFLIIQKAGLLKKYKNQNYAIKIE